MSQNMSTMRGHTLTTIAAVQVPMMKTERQKLGPTSWFSAFSRLDSSQPEIDERARSLDITSRFLGKNDSAMVEGE